MGHVDNPIPYYKKAKLCVVSSIKEGFPNVLLEMMAVNDSVVSTLCAGGIEKIPSILKVEPNNINSLTSAIGFALADYPSQKNDSRQDYLKDRSPELFISSILEELHRVNSL
jgi:glycosyltransferase involved in cell wall biosynthesis